MEKLLIVIAVLGMLVFVVTSVMIYDYMIKRGEKANFFLMRLYIIPYAIKYKEITKKETGKTGKLFYAWIISVNTALACIILVGLLK